MRLVRPIAMTNANILRKENYLEKSAKINFKKYKYKLWYKNDKFPSFIRYGLLNIHPKKSLFILHLQVWNTIVLHTSVVIIFYQSFFERPLSFLEYLFFVFGISTFLNYANGKVMTS